MGRSSWQETLISSIRNREVSPLGELLPSFPSEELQRNTTGLSSEATLRQAYAFYEDVVDAMKRAGYPLDSRSKVLDFGYGWGRISRVFMKDVSIANIHGIDVDPEFSRITNGLFGTDNFIVGSPFPPTPYVSEGFDLIYAYSVFSHLSGDACHAWMAEFGRLLKPGGVVAFTTRHVSFMDYCEWAKGQTDADPYLKALGDLFPDIGEARRQYAAGELVHGSSDGVSGGGPRDSTFYGETWIPEPYVRTRFGAKFEFVEKYFDPNRYDQICFALRRAA